MDKVSLKGEDAITFLQSYSVLKIIDEVMPKNLEEILESGYTDDMKEKMSREAFVLLAISNEMQKISEGMNRNMQELTKLKGPAMKVDVIQFPEISIECITQEDIDKRNEQIKKKVEE